MTMVRMVDHCIDGGGHDEKDVDRGDELTVLKNITCINVFIIFL